MCAPSVCRVANARMGSGRFMGVALLRQHTHLPGSRRAGRSLQLASHSCRPSHPHSGIRIVSASAGVTHSMALAADGSLYTWGDGRYGQLGHNEMQNVAAPNQVVVMTTPHKIHKLDPAPLAPENRRVPGRAGGRLFAKPSAAMGACLPAPLLASITIRASLSLAAASAPHRVTAIAAGAYHSMALTVGGTLLAFGRNNHGQLGAGDLQHRWKPTKVDLHGEDAYDGKGKRVIQVSCGTAHSVVLLMNHGTLEVRSTGGHMYDEAATPVWAFYQLCACMLHVVRLSSHNTPCRVLACPPASPACHARSG